MRYDLYRVQLHYWGMTILGRLGLAHSLDPCRLPGCFALAQYIFCPTRQFSLLFSNI
jgi:hypothetical protein